MLVKIFNYLKLLPATVLAMMMLTGPAFADSSVQDLNTQVSTTALFIAFTVIVVVSVFFIIKHQYIFLSTFLGVSLIVVLIVATKGMIIMVPVKWVASWFSVPTIGT